MHITNITGTDTLTAENGTKAKIKWDSFQKHAFKNKHVKNT
jgi:hypothetical protein